MGREKRYLRAVARFPRQGGAHFPRKPKGDRIAVVSQRPYSSMCGHESQGSVVTLIANWQAI